jgi:O-acetyl-ADP-ribose deacetylase
MKIRVEKATLNELNVDAIVNPANSYGYMGGGIAGAIKEAGGQEVELEAISQAPIPIGTAVITSGGSLGIKIIHSPTMEQPAASTDLETIKEATKAALDCADENNIKQLAIPGMGTGIGQVPKDKAALAILEILLNFEPQSIQEVILFEKNDEMIAAFNKALNG